MSEALARPERSSHQSVERALSVLSSFDERHAELGLADIRRTLGLHKSTVSRLAGVLERAGFLRRHGDRYRLGVEMMRLGSLALDSFELISSLRPQMERLAAATGETVNLAVPDRGEVLNVAEIESRHILSTGWVGRRTPAHAAANGKVLLAFGAMELPKEPLTVFASATVSSLAALDEELSLVRARGYATAVSELEEGLAVAAAPVFDTDGRCVAALSVSGPSSRLSLSELDRLGEMGLDV